MNFLRIFELFLKTRENNVASDKHLNNNSTRTRETSIDKRNSQINDNNSNKLKSECNIMINNNENYTNNNSSVVSTNEFGVTNVLHNLANAAPIEIMSKDNTYNEPKENEICLNVGPEENKKFNNATEAGSIINVIEDEPEINQNNNDLTQIQDTYKAMVSNEVTYITKADTFKIDNNNSNKPDTEYNVSINNNEVYTNDSSVVIIDEFGVTKILHNPANFAPMGIRPNDNTYTEHKENEIGLNVGPEDNRILNPSEARSVINVVEDEPDMYDLTQIRDSYKAMVSNDVTYNTEADTFKTDDDNSNNPETECNVTINNNEDYTNDSSVVIIDEFGITKILHNLTNIAPMEISPNDNTYKEPKENEIGLNFGPEGYIILNNYTEASSVVNVIKDEPDINQSDNDLTHIQDTYKAMVSNDATYDDDETIENLKEFEEALNDIDKTAMTDDFGTELINLDDFMEIFDELDAENEDLVSISGPLKSVFKNNEITTYSKENGIKSFNENETSSNINENIDIISINSSTEDEKSQIKDTIHAAFGESDSDDGYNSSDFEFISEAEANMAVIVINNGLEDNQNLSQASSDSEPLIRFSRKYFDGENEKEASDPGEGPSRQNRPRNELEDGSYRNEHHIPLGDDYLGLFQGIYNPQLPMSEIYFLENKSVRVSAMNSQYDGIGFDRQLALMRHLPDSSEDEFEDEAKETAKKILKKYPEANRKRKRR